MAEFALTVEASGDSCVVAASGEIDAHTAPRLSAEGRNQLDEQSVRRLVVDLSGVTFLDSTGIAALVRLRNKALDGSKQFMLRNPAPRVLKVLTITALDTVFDIEAVPAD